MAKLKDLWIVLIAVLILYIAINVVPFMFIKQDSSYFAYIGAAVSAINLVITGFAAGIGFYLAKVISGN